MQRLVPGRATTDRSALQRPAILAAVFLAAALPLVWQSIRSSADISHSRAALVSDTTELRYIGAFGPLLFDLAQARALANRPRAASETLPQLESRIDATLRSIDRSGVARDVPAATCETTWTAWRHGYHAWERTPHDAGLVKLIMQATCFVNARMDTASITYDTDPTVQLVTAVVALNIPGLLRRVGATASLVDRYEVPGYDRAAVAAISRSNGYVARIQNNIDAYIQEDEKHNDRKLSAELTAFEEPERKAEVRFESQVDAIITAPQPKPAAAEGAERLGLALVAEIRPLWQRSYRELELRVAREKDALQMRTLGAILFVAIGLAVALATLLGAGRIIDTVHRRQVTRLELERDSLAAELSRAAAERTLSLTEGQLQAVFESADAAIAVLDDRRSIVRANRSFTEMEARYPSLVELAREHAGATFESVAAPARLEITLGSATAPAWLNFSLAAVFEGAVCRYVIVTVTDVTDTKAHEKRLRDASLRDPLTGLANRKAFVENLVAACDAPHGVVAVMFIDLDKFKPINDGFGHASGDAVLETVGARLRGAVASSDVVARFGGDEFAVLIRDVGNVEVARSIAERIGRSIDLPIAIPRGVVNVSASIGVALENAFDCAASPEELLDRADAAMYRAKAAETPYVLDNGSIAA
jgi:diguanylate cyclase (GGDEF)-like protein